jgi:hypothetical protein
MLYAVVGSIVGVFVGEMILLRLANLYSPFIMLNQYGQVGAALFALVSLILVSTILSSVNEKRKREAFLMLPSSNLEKFLALMTYTSVVCVLGVFLTFVLGDSLRMAWLWISGPYTEAEVSYIGNPTEYYYWWSSAIPEMVNRLSPHVLEADSYSQTWLYVAMNIVVIAAIAVWTHSLLIIGGTLLRKYSFVISSLVMILSFFLAVWIGDKIGFDAFYVDAVAVKELGTDHDVNMYEQKISFGGYMLSILIPLAACFNYWASYHIF